METQPSVRAHTRADPAHRPQPRPQPRMAEGGAPDCPEHPEPGTGALAAGRRADTHLRRPAPAKALIPCHWAGGATVHQTQDTSPKSGHLRVTPAWAQPPQAARAEASLENQGRRWRRPSTPLKSPDAKAAPTCEATGQLLGSSVTRCPGTAPASETAVKTNGTTWSAGNGGCRTKETAHSTGQPADEVLHQRADRDRGGQESTLRGQGPRRQARANGEGLWGGTRPRSISQHTGAPGPADPQGPGTTDKHGHVGLSLGNAPRSTGELGEQDGGGGGVEGGAPAPDAGGSLTRAIFRKSRAGLGQRASSARPRFRRPSRPRARTAASGSRAGPDSGWARAWTWVWALARCRPTWGCALRHQALLRRRQAASRGGRAVPLWWPAQARGWPERRGRGGAGGWEGEARQPGAPAAVAVPLDDRSPDPGAARAPQGPAARQLFWLRQGAAVPLGEGR